MKNFEKNLLTQMRTVLINEPSKELTDEGMIQAMTLNEEIKELGFTLRPEDIVRLAKIEKPESVLEKLVEEYAFKDYKPMYPDFPNQVLSIEESEYRFHQMVHYFSTYGMEFLFGVEVSQGWMPPVEETEKTEKDERLRDLEVLELATEKEAMEKVSKSIVSKKERWIPIETELVEAVAEKNPELINNITFKENIGALCTSLKQNNCSKDLQVDILKRNCLNVEDVFKTVEAVKNFYEDKLISRALDTKPKKNLPTSEKRMFVNLLESFPIENFEENIALKRDRNVYLLDRYLSYNRFSIKPEYKEAVNSLRNDELRTFNSKVDEKIKEHAEDTLSFYATRPGMMLRDCGRLLRSGWTEDEIFNALKDKDFKAQTLITNINNFSNPMVEHEYGDPRVIYGRSEKRTEEEVKSLISLNRKLLVANMERWDTEFKGKSIYVQEGQFDLNHSIISTNDKNEEGGYLRAGLSVRIPKEANVVRMLVFWNNEKERVDVDMHALAYDKDDKMIHVGWNADYKTEGIYMSGDITTSKNSAEFIDVDLNGSKKVEYVTMNIHSFTGQNFKDIEKCFVGIMPVKELGENVEQYNPQNLIFCNDLETNKTFLEYGLINLKEGYVRLFCQDETFQRFRDVKGYSIQDYLEDFTKAQHCTMENDKRFADMIIRVDKGENENEHSLVDRNFFLPTDKNETPAQAEEKTKIIEGLTK